MKKIKLSIIMVVKNGLPYIKQAIESYNSQKYKNKELIIVCSPSYDGTENFLKNLKKRNSDRYKIFFDKKSKNKFGSLNKGISLAKGNYIGILHSDDIFFSVNILNQVVKKLTKFNCDFLYGDCAFINKNNSKIIREWVAGKFNQKKLKFGWMPPHTTTFIKKKIFLKDKYNLDYRISGDYEFLLRILNKNIKVNYIEKKICKMKVGGDSTSIKNIFSKFREDYNIANMYFSLPLLTIIIKVIQKVNQFKIF